MDIYEYATLVEYHSTEFAYHIVIDKSPTKGESTVRRSDGGSDIEFSFLKLCVDDYDEFNYKFGEFLYDDLDLE